MTIEDIREFKKNAIAILEKDTQYATARAVEEAFMALACLGQYMWERDIAISQLEELGLSLGQKVNGVYLSKEKYEELLEYKKCTKIYVIKSWFHQQRKEKNNVSELL